MKMILGATIFAIATLACTVPAQADNRAPGVNHRQHKQHARITQGVRSGELTRQEARSLRAKQRAIRAEERAFKADGTLTKSERKALHRDLNEASRDIHREKHDGETR